MFGKVKRVQMVRLTFEVNFNLDYINLLSLCIDMGFTELLQTSLKYLQKRIMERNQQEKLRIRDTHSYEILSSSKLYNYWKI